MKCPNDSATLVMSERAGVEIDYCPDCRGVWLDRGELDKILDRAEQETRPAAAAPAAPAAPLGGYPEPGRDDRRRDDDRDRSYGSRDDRSYGMPDDRGRGSSGYPSAGGYGQGDGYGGKRRKKESWLSELFD
jgi:Zn-finger nucleic acid-binding protein